MISPTIYTVLILKLFIHKANLWQAVILLLLIICFYSNVVFPNEKIFIRKHLSMRNFCVIPNYYCTRHLSSRLLHLTFKKSKTCIPFSSRTPIDTLYIIWPLFSLQALDIYSNVVKSPLSVGTWINDICAYTLQQTDNSSSYRLWKQAITLWCFIF